MKISRLLIVIITLFCMSSCYDEPLTKGIITVYDSEGNTVNGAIVKLYQEDIDCEAGDLCDHRPGVLHFLHECGPNWRICLLYPSIGKEINRILYYLCTKNPREIKKNFLIFRQ